MAALHHPGIADVYDFGQEPGDVAYLVMAEVGGEPLNRRIAARGRLTVPGTMSIVAQVARALQAAHEAGIVHRDVKPANIIVQPDGRAVLVDFGIARSAASARLTGAGEIVGTAHYIAPEQVRKQPVGPAADVYALGAVAYHCLAGYPPFLGDNPVFVAAQHVSQEPPPLPADVPPAVRALVTTALAKDPAARFPSAAAMARAAESSVARAGDTVPLGAVRPLAEARDTAALSTPRLGTLRPAGHHDGKPLTSPETVPRAGVPRYHHHRAAGAAQQPPGGAAEPGQRVRPSRRRVVLPSPGAPHGRSLDAATSSIDAGALSETSALAGSVACTTSRSTSAAPSSGR